ncbi:putative 2OG-Fe(II) oxygenase [Sphingomonas sp. PB4P5]|uniref:putative 2OG-Fe(II) oxygenase n=1 Tax=Parasphingomonas puruogangriensis TaxID=3096155 RepID=UPI002FCBE02D
MRAYLEEDAIDLLRAAAERHRGHAALSQVYGLVARNLGDMTTACAALSRAHQRAPADALIAHGLARARIEAGLPAIDAYQRALQLAPADGAVILGFAAARFAERDVDGAIDNIAAIVERQPLWLDGHATLARLRGMAARDDDMGSYRRALAQMPQAAALWQAWLATLVAAERFTEIPAVIAAARQAAPATPGLDLYEAVAADETGDIDRAGGIFDRLPYDDNIAVIIRKVRSLLRRDRIVEAAALAERSTTLAGGNGLWPYLALAWRLLGDPRWAWLEGDAAFVQVHDLGDTIGDLEALAARLRSLHIASAQPLDQSVRGGTQTDGALFLRIDPEIRRLRSAVDKAVAAYIAALPPPDPTHPLLGVRRRPVRFAGSWSVRLTDGGHHTDHVHGQGWISSAFYVALPPGVGADDDAGWLTLGASRALLPDLQPLRRIEPKPGRLVLFPSTMWHGTNRFAAGERLTVAFDMARLI